MFGVDLAVAPLAAPGAGAGAAAARPAAQRPGPRRRLPRAAAAPALPRVVLLARDGRGWAALCRLVSATHLAGERGAPVSSLELVAEHAGAAAQAGSLAVLLGPASELGRAVAARRDDLARAHLDRWRDVLGARRGRRRGRLPPRPRATPAGPPGCSASPTEARRRRGAHQRRPLRRPLRRPDRRRARRRPPAGRPRPPPRRPRQRRGRAAERQGDGGGRRARSPAPPGSATTAAGCSPAPATRPSAAPSTRAADLGIGDGPLPRARGHRRRRAEAAARCCASAARPASAAAALPLRRAARSTRLEDELGVIGRLGYPSYFLTVADVVDLIKGMGVRVAARGSGAGSLVTYLLGISDVDPLRYGLLMERFLSPLRHQLPDIDVDVESARRTEVYEQILADVRRRALHLRVDDGHLPRPARHPRRRRRARPAARRDRRAGQGVPAHPGQPGARGDARPARAARQRAGAAARTPAASTCCCAWSSGSTGCRATSRCTRAGCCCPTRTLLDRTPVESSWLGFPMSQFDKDDVEELGLLKLDVLGIRMQSAMSHAVAARSPGSTARSVDVDAVPRDDPRDVRAGAVDPDARLLPDRVARASASWSASSRRRPSRTSSSTSRCSGRGRSRATWCGRSSRRGRAGSRADYLHPDLEPALEQTYGVVVFHEQVLQIVATMTGCTPGRGRRGAPRARRPRRASPRCGPGSCRPRSAAATTLGVVERVWEVLKAFGSFGFCKAHAAAFALPTYQSAWLKAHHPAAFLAGVLTHDPGMYPKRLILDDARQFGIAVLVARRQPLRRRLPGRAGRRARRAAARGARPGRRAGRRLRPSRR